MIELPDHPFFVASQFHPEFNSRPNRPEPLFREFVGAAARHAGERPADGEALEPVEPERAERPDPVADEPAAAEIARRARAAYRPAPWVLTLRTAL